MNWPKLFFFIFYNYIDIKKVINSKFIFQMSSFTPHSAEYYLTHDVSAELKSSGTPWHTPSAHEEDLCLANQINTVVDYRNELQMKQSTPTRMRPQSNYSASPSTSRTATSPSKFSTSSTVGGTSSRNFTASSVKSSNPYMDDAFVEAQIAKSTPWHTPEAHEEDLCLANQINTVVDYRNELAGKKAQLASRPSYSATTSPARPSYSGGNPRLNPSFVDGTMTPTRPSYSGGNPRLNPSYLGEQQGSKPTYSGGDPRLNPSYLMDQEKQRPTYSGGDPRLNPSYLMDQERQKPTYSGGDPRLNPSYLMDQERQKPTYSGGDPRLNPSYLMEEERQKPTYSGGDPRLNPSYLMEEERQKPTYSGGDPRLNPSYLMEEERQKPTYSGGDPRLNPSYLMEDEAAKPTYSGGNPRLNPSYLMEEEAAKPTYSGGNPRLNPSYIEGTEYPYSEERDYGTPWHLPDARDEDLCLANQINTIVDYRNELNAKSGIASRAKANRFTNYSYGSSGIVGDHEDAANYRTSRGSSLGYGNVDDEFDSDADNIPWHTPDEADEDLCLANQMNILVDYRKELAGKQKNLSGRGSPSRAATGQASPASTGRQPSRHAQGTLNSSYITTPYGPQANAQSSPSKVKGESVPWHLPDEEDEDLCLANQINVLVDYRNDLKAKQDALKPKTKKPSYTQQQMQQQQPQKLSGYSRPEPQHSHLQSSQRRTAPQPQQRVSTYSAPVSPARASHPQQVQQQRPVHTSTVSSHARTPQKVSYVPQRQPQSPIRQTRVSHAPPPPPPPVTSTASKTSPYQSKAYTSFHPNESQSSYKYIAVDDDEYNSLSDSLSYDSDEYMEKNYKQRSSKKSNQDRRLHKALAHLDNASRILDMA